MANYIHIAVLVLRVGRLDKAIADRIKTIAHAIKHVVRAACHRTAQTIPT